MSKFYVGSEVGQLRRVMLHRPNLSLKRWPSNCQDLLFDDVLSVERAGQEHDKFAQVLRDQNVEVFLLTNLLAETLDGKPNLAAAASGLRLSPRHRAG